MRGLRRSAVFGAALTAMGLFGALTGASPLPAEAVSEPSQVKNSDRGVTRMAEGTSPGLNIMTSYVDFENCLLFENAGKILGTIPGIFCGTVPGKGFLSVREKQLWLVDSAMKRLWKRDLPGFHHDVQVSSETSEIAVLLSHAEDLPFKLGQIVFDDIRIFNFNGDTVFNWSERDHVAELRKISDAVKPWRTPKGDHYEIGHMNAVQVIPGGAEAKWGPSFRKGNLLVTINNLSCLLVIERPSGKIVWSYSDEGYNEAYHSARFTADHEIVYVRNGSVRDGSRSAIAVIGPGDKSPRWMYTAKTSGRFFSRRFGHVSPLPNGNFLVTHNPDGGAAFEVTREKKIVWEWVREASVPPRSEVFQVIRLPEDQARYFRELLK